jgi:hypothetical protein
LVGATLAFGLFAAPAAAGTAESTITIKANGGDFFGKVKSEVSLCEGFRDVVLFKQRPGKDAKIAMDTTENDGSWNAGNTGQTKGTFYAKVKEAGDCEKGRSNKIVLPQENMRARDTDAAELTIRSDGGDFFGKLKSDDIDTCGPNRKVNVYKVVPGADKKIASDDTDQSGEWSTGNNGAKRGRFYAKVRPTDVTMRSCEGARSKTIEL